MEVTRQEFDSLQNRVEMMSKLVNSHGDLIKSLGVVVTNVFNTQKSGGVILLSYEEKIQELAKAIEACAQTQIETYALIQKHLPTLQVVK